LAKYYESESDAKIKTLTSMFEPVIIILIGLGVAFIVFAIIMPIYQIAELG
jgi:type II secretory pathway component PulF